MNEEKWLNEIFDSSKGKRELNPSADLFDKILERIEEKGAIVIPMRQIRVAAAAAILFFFINVFAVLQVTQNRESATSSSIDFTESINSDYNLYDL